MADLIKDIEILSSIDYPKMLAMDVLVFLNLDFQILTPLQRRYRRGSPIKLNKGFTGAAQAEC